MNYEVYLVGEEQEEMLSPIYGNDVITSYITLKQGQPESGKKINFKLNDLYALSGFCWQVIYPYQRPVKKGLNTYRIKSREEKQQSKQMELYKGQAAICLNIVLRILSLSLANKKVVFKVL